MNKRVRGVINEGMEMFLANYWDWQNYDESLADAVEQISIKYKVKPQRAMEDLKKVIPTEEELLECNLNETFKIAIGQGPGFPLNYKTVGGDFSSADEAKQYLKSIGAEKVKGKKCWLDDKKYYHIFKKQINENYPDDFNAGAFNSYWGGNDELDDALYARLAEELENQAAVLDVNGYSTDPSDYEGELEYIVDALMNNLKSFVEAEEEYAFEGMYDQLKRKAEDLIAPKLKNYMGI